MTKKRELEVLMKSLMINGTMIDDRMIHGLKDGIREIRRIEFREKQERKRRQYAKKEQKVKSCFFMTPAVRSIFRHSAGRRVFHPVRCITGETM